MLAAEHVARPRVVAVLRNHRADRLLASVGVVDVGGGVVPGAFGQEDRRLVVAPVGTLEEGGVSKESGQ